MSEHIERLHLILSDRMDDFMKRYAPKDDSYAAVDFRRALDSLVYTAMEIAQKPFAYELKTFRDATFNASMLTPIIKNRP